MLDDKATKDKEAWKIKIISAFIGIVVGSLVLWFISGINHRQQNKIAVISTKEAALEKTDKSLNKAVKESKSPNKVVKVENEVKENKSPNKVITVENEVKESKSPNKILEIENKPNIIIPTEFKRYKITLFVEFTEKTEAEKAISDLKKACSVINSSFSVKTINTISAKGLKKKNGKDVEFDIRF